MDLTVGVGVKAGVERAVGIKPRNAVAGLAADAAEQPAHQNLPSACTARASTKKSRWGQSWRQRAVGIKPRDVVAGLATDAGEDPAHQNLAIGLHRKGKDSTRSCRIGDVGVKAGVERAVGTKPRNVVAGLAADAAEGAAHQNLAVGLHCKGTDYTVRVGVKAGVERAVGIKPRDLVAGLAADAGEVPARHNLAIGLYRNGIDNHGSRWGQSWRPSEPSGLSSAMRLRVWPPMLVKNPPTRIFRRPALQGHGHHCSRWGQSCRPIGRGWSKVNKPAARRAKRKAR